ncbi:MAG TPA: hypothetical protein VM869_20985 [Enhygromyxa sp.]|nr:hypothetical protein [Enhygromyxa sp.]
MIITALLFLAIAIGSAVIGMYGNPEQGVDQIMYWLAIVCIGVAAAFTLISLALRRYGD